MKNSRFGCLVVALVTLNVPFAHAASAQSSNSCELRPVMLENFDEETAPNRRIESISSSRIGPARWTAHTPWGGDFGDASFMDPGPGGPFKMKDGILSITASKTNRGGGLRASSPQPTPEAWEQEHAMDISKRA